MKSYLFPVLSLVLILGSCGCAGVKNSMGPSEKNSRWNPLNRSTSKTNDQESSSNPLQQLILGKTKKPPAKPVAMTAIWKDSVYERPGTPTVKGFGGRFYFYDENNVPVKAVGELIVYGFDDSKTEKTDSVADKKFIFQSEKFQKHFSESAIGASYSVWIPWEKIGGFRKSITLIPVFRMVDGTVLKSGQATVNLPGKTPEPQNAETSNEMPYRVLGSSPAVVQQADFKASSSTQSEPSSNIAKAAFENESNSGTRIRTSTFQLTKNLSERMARARNPQHANGRQGTRSAAVTEASEFGKANLESEIAVNTKHDSTNQNKHQSSPNLELSKPKRPVFGQPGSY